MAHSLPEHWTEQLPAVAACGLIPSLPPLAALRKLADAAVTIPSTPASASEPLGAAHLFHSRPLYDAVRSCVVADPGIPPEHKLAASLLITSVAMEHFVRSHSTKARLIASQQARVARMAKEQEEEAKAAVDADEDAKLLNFFLKSGKAAICDKLVVLLREPESQRDNIMRLVDKHTPADLVAILKAMKRTHDLGDTMRADGSGSKTLGGLFFREAKRLKASANLTEAQRAFSPLPPLRSYQRDVVGLALVSWGLQLTEEVLTAPPAGSSAAASTSTGRASGDAEVEERAESEAELRARWQDMAAGWSGNWLVSAPTNSGKTRMFVEVARGVIASKPSRPRAVVMVLVPSVILTNQHAAAFMSAQLPATQVRAYSSDNQLSAQVWWAMRNAADQGVHASVAVVTAESFVNLLRAGRAMIGQVDLLILDEAHHCKDEHSYAHVMSYYNSTPAKFCRPRVLAVTASPASESDKMTLDRRMNDMLQRLGARLYLVDAADPDVVEVLPKPTRVELRVVMRHVDRQMMLMLQTFALDTATDIAEALAVLAAVGIAANRDKAQLEQDLLVVIAQCQSTLATGTGQNLVTRLDPLGQWLSRGREFAFKYGCHNLDLGCRLLDVLRKAVELVEDAGFEGSLPFLGRKAAILCRDELEVNGGIGAVAGGLGRRRQVPPCPAGTAVRKEMAASVAAAAASGGVEEPGLFTALAAAAAAMPSGHEVAVRLEAGRVANGSAAPPGNSCPDIPLLVSAELKKLLTVSDGDGRTLISEELLADCFMSGELKEEYTFPKFWALLSYLQRYKDKPQFHGIIFVRTRQTVFHVTDMIRRAEQLQFMEVLELIGHNSSTKRAGLSTEHDRHGRGMSDSQQQLVVQAFKEPGRKVLVATSAAEEGLDVPSCEFVVRYNAAETGIQLLQSRGRARQREAEFCAILQDGTLDRDLHAKSRLEEANMHQWQRTFTEVTRRSSQPVEGQAAAR